MSNELKFNSEIESMTSPLYKKIQGAIPEIEWPTMAPYIYEINKLKKEKDVTILAHNYQAPEIFYGVADIVGDSLGLAIDGAKVKTDKILMCGVHFMAETAKIMSPEKKIILPDLSAGCSLAESITPADVRKLKEENPECQLLLMSIHPLMLKLKQIYVVHLLMRSKLSSLLM